MGQFDGMSRDELARAISEFNQNGQAGASSQPKVQKTAGDAYTESILQKPAGSWTQAEKDHIRGGINAALKDLGY